ncbi:MAG: TIGR03620 family F420-dependent LLM class oxidoreductase [Gammaproteobacteria bacterium]|nr:TIGR03620 family F420-dependent LLM class oxidoreductase [Gammaproteobacteria bacterium]
MSAVTRGVIALLDERPAGAFAAFADAVEARGYDSLWLPELFGREPIASAAHLLARTSRLHVATGIVNVYGRDPHALAQARHTLAELSDGRFVLGLGVSNVEVNGARGHAWQAPLAKMRATLDALEAVQVQSVAPATPAPLVLAAHGPALQRLGAARCDGILTYLMSPAHTRRSRERVGPDTQLNVVCALLAEPDAVRARRTARAALAWYLGLDYYHREWRKLGYTDADFADGGSDALVDMLVGWGDAAALEARIAAHVDAGADRIIVMPIDAMGAKPRMTTLDAVAPAR